MSRLAPRISHQRSYREKPILKSHSNKDRRSFAKINAYGVSSSKPSSSSIIPGIPGFNPKNPDGSPKIPVEPPRPPNPGPRVPDVIDWSKAPQYSPWIFPPGFQIPGYVDPFPPPPPSVLPPSAPPVKPRPGRIIDGGSDGYRIDPLIPIGPISELIGQFIPSNPFTDWVNKLFP